MNASLNSNRLATYSSQQRGISNFVKRIGGVYSIKSVVLRPDFSRIFGCVLRRSVCSHCAGLDDDDAKWSVWLKLSSIFNRTFKLSIFVMMSLPRHNHGQGYITYSLASAAIQDLRADNVPGFASFMVRKCNRKALFWSGFKPIRLPN